MADLQIGSGVNAATQGVFEKAPETASIPFNARYTRRNGITAVNYVKAALIGLATFFAGFALWRLMVLSLQIMEPYIVRRAASSASVPGWSISLGPHSGLILLLLISVVVAYRQYCRLRDRNRGAR